MSFNPSQTLVFIDANVDEYQHLVQGVKPGIEVEILDAHRDGIEQITAFLFTRPHIETVHIVSHGSPGCLYLGNAELSLDTLENYANLLQTWSASEIVLYGCNVAAGDAGVEFVEKLYKLTNADIAASTTPTGNAALQGDWTLKRFISQTPAELAFSETTQASYRGILNPQVNIEGDIEEDGTLRATVSGTDANITYQWQSSEDQTNWTDIADATDSTFTPGDNEVGKYIRVNAFLGTSETVSAVAGEGIFFQGNFDTPGSARAVFIEGNLAFVADDGSGLQIIDISDRTRPTPRGGVDTPGSAKDIAVAGNYAYIADDTRGLTVVNISNPASPSVITSVRGGRTNTANIANGISLQGDYAYISDDTNGLVIFDITNPTAPVKKANIATGGEALDVAVQGNYAYVADGSGNSALTIFNISNPNNPTEVKKMRTGGNARGITVVNNYAYVANGTSGLAVIDISNPNDPKGVGSFNTPGNARGVSVAGNFAYVADEAGGLHVINISDPTAPTLEYSFDTPGAALGVSVVDNLVYVADGNKGLQVLNLETNPPTVANINDNPTNISLSNNSIDENEAVGTLVGTLQTTDVDPEDTHTYSLIAVAGDTGDNNKFEIVGNQLRTRETLDFETKNSYTIRIQTTDKNGGTFQKQLTINVDNVNEIPTDITLDTNSLDENQAIGTVVGTLTSTDEDTNDSHSYRLVAGVGDTDNGLFDLVEGQLRTKASFDFETKSSYNIRVETDDKNGGTFQKQLTINVDNVNEIPTDITLDNNSLDENQAIGTVVGTLTSTDEDTNENHTYSLVAGVGDTDNALFEVVNGELRTKASFDFETKSSYSVRIQTSDKNGETFQKPFTINVGNVNENPTDISLSDNSLEENQAVGTVVGTFTSIDEDTNDNHTYSLVAGVGDTDNALFEVVNGELKTKAVLDFESKNSYNIRVQTHDGNGGTFDKPFTINVGNVNEIPTDISLSNNSLEENQAIGTVVGTFTTADVDPTDTHTYSLVAGVGDTDNALFEVVNGELKTKAVLDFESKDSYNIRVQTNDGKGG
ncbi:MAG: DUF4347 domain-containing protein, partial [Lyngbya sp.]|nr:DUF4347 domain-containing protein [Lyngbya sp.]